MFEQFFLGAQQDLKLFICFPILCAIFRAIFIATQKPDGSLEGKGKALFQCFRFGFWWGMDINAYVFVLSLVVVTLPGLFFAPWAAHGDKIRLVLGMIYAMAIYLAFIGKQIFYAQFHDIFNNIVFLGEKAEKNNLVDVFFNQYHGARRLACIVPYAILVYFGIYGILHTPVLAYPHFAGAWAYVFNTVIVLALIAFFYFFRYGGTFMHDDKPEWDTIPDIVKDDPFLSKISSP
jgi:lipoteichoic acid synthase